MFDVGRRKEFKSCFKKTWSFVLHHHQSQVANKACETTWQLLINDFCFAESAFLLMLEENQLCSGTIAMQSPSDCHLISNCHPVWWKTNETKKTNVRLRILWENSQLFQLATKANLNVMCSLNFKIICEATVPTAWFTFADAPVINKFQGDNQLAFSRGRKAFLAINKQSTTLSQKLQTGLPAGTYCNVFLGEVKNGRCTGGLWQLVE